MQSYSLFVFPQRIDVQIDVLDTKFFSIVMFRLYLVYASIEGMLVCWYYFDSVRALEIHDVRETPLGPGAKKDGCFRRLIDHFTDTSLMTCPLNGSEAGVDLVLIQTSLLLLCKSSCSYAN